MQDLRSMLLVGPLCAGSLLVKQISGTSACIMLDVFCSGFQALSSAMP